ncbi:LysM peptidoglycan-binding domain-containing protein [Niallia sp. Sow4_A1]|uniref:LysM peptidoglycan-binding domain-containing protein n=1 Tax=Bacillaceae TaxID=186817 RepID=UPI000689FA8D|nr:MULTISPECIES: LysM peptidoglycan-binding domain-containing protein [Bacillaceae]
MFLKPTSVTYISNGFRSTGKDKHFGIDFAQNGINAIRACADGKVTKSYFSTSYGECIMILHNISGKEYETVYAHLKSGSRKVKVGEYVKKGQVIGIMGNTGDSTGQHLHFELHIGRWNNNKTNAVNPLPYFESDTEAIPSSNNEYIVKKGDTLYEISRKYKTTIKVLAAYNQIANPNLIKVGQKIKIPSTQAVYYVVKKGDTVSQIAKTFHTSVSKIEKWNQLKDVNKIYPGQKLRVG